jgi:hypothetical protein
MQFIFEVLFVLGMKGDFSTYSMDLYTVDGMRYSLFWVVMQRMLQLFTDVLRHPLCPSSRVGQFLDDGTDRLSRNFGKQLPTCVA